MAGFQKQVEGTNVLVDSEVLTKDNTRIPVEITSSSITVESGNYLFAVFKNISDRTLAEEKQRLYSSLIDATLESTADGILVVDKAWRVLLYNQKFSDMWRLPTDIAARNGSDELGIDHFVAQAAETGKFMTTIMDIYSKPEEISLDIVELKDGRIIERYSQPHRLADAVVVRVVDETAG